MVMAMLLPGAEGFAPASSRSKSTYSRFSFSSGSESHSASSRLPLASGSFTRRITAAMAFTTSGSGDQVLPRS